MKKKLCRLIFYRLLGWRTIIDAPFHDKCVICVVPHTSNWDLIYGWLFYGCMGRSANFMMKKEWFFFPLNFLFRALGAVPINRNKRSSTVEQMVKRFEQTAYFNLAITPEGTRKGNPRWKTGFYYIALQAQVPIVVAAFDYKNRQIWWEKTLIPSGDIEKDMAEMKAYYQKRGQAKHFERYKLYET